MKFKYVIIGAGSAGRTAAETLVEEDPGSSILLIDEESYLPYKRTQVSKKAATGFEAEDFAIRDSTWYRENGVTLQTGCSVRSIDIDTRNLATDKGEFTYEKLLLALGSGPKRINGNLPDGRYCYLWNKEDAIRFRSEIPRFNRVAIIGNGVLGVEAAYQVRLLQREAVLIGNASRPMSRYLNESCSRELNTVLVENDVELLSGCGVLEVHPSESGLTISTSCGDIRADYVVLTAGSSPRLSLAEGSGIPVDSGILVNEDLSTSIDGIWAAGDCAQHPDRRITGLWHSAESQGKLAASGMAGKPARNTNPPYRLKCEVFGGLWFSAGSVNEINGTNSSDPVEEWRYGDILWRPVFRNDELIALSGSAPRGMSKAYAKAAQKLVLEGANRKTSYSVLSDV